MLLTASSTCHLASISLRSLGFAVATATATAMLFSTTFLGAAGPLFASSPLRLFDPSRIPRWDTSAVYYLAHVTAQAAAVFARPKTRRIAFVTLFFVYFPGNFPLSTT